MPIHDALMGNTAYGRAAMKRFGAVSENFRIFSAGWVEEKPEDWQSMRVSGAEFAAPTRGPSAGKLTIRIPHTTQTVLVTRAEIEANRDDAKLRP